MKNIISPTAAQELAKTMQTLPDDFIEWLNNEIVKGYAQNLNRITISHPKDLISPPYHLTDEQYNSIQTFLKMSGYDSTYHRHMRDGYLEVFLKYPEVLTR